MKSCMHIRIIVVFPSSECVQSSWSFIEGDQTPIQKRGIYYTTYIAYY
jgi:hypothetical protein